MTLRPLHLGEQLCPNISQDFSVSTWNVWFDKLEREARNRALLDALEQHKPELMSFQEVTPPFIRALQACEWLKSSGYWISATEHNQIGVVMVGRVAYERLYFHPLTSSMGRRLLVLELANGLCIASAHFESNRTSSETRRIQLTESFRLLREHPASMLLGDFNSSPEDPENDAVPRHAVDAWPHLRATEQGFTFDTELNSMALAATRNKVQVRMDRVYCTGALQPKAAELLGTQACGDKLFASDHFGLLVRF